MRKYQAILLMGLLSGCMNNYHPPLAEEPKDQIKYEADLKDCIVYMKKAGTPDVGRSMIIGATGLIGYGIMEATKDDDDPYFKSPKELVDGCMIKKGYKIASK